MAITEYPKRIVRTRPDPNSTSGEILECEDGSVWRKCPLKAWNSTGSTIGYRDGNQIKPLPTMRATHPASHLGE